MAAIQTIATTKDTNDIFLDASGNLAMAEDKPAIANIVLNVVRTNRGELQYNKSAGIPYFDVLFVANPNLRIWADFLRKETLRVPGTISITDFTYKVTNEVLTYSMTVETNIGDVVVNG